MELVQVTREELLDPEEYSDIVDDVTSELETKYGTLASIVIPQPSQKGPAADPSGVGLVFVQFANLSNAVRLFTACLPGPHPMLCSPVVHCQLCCGMLFQHWCQRQSWDW